jgi:hypothetical protein
MKLSDLIGLSLESFCLPKKEIIMHPGHTWTSSLNASIVPDITAGLDDIKIAERLLTAYQLSMADNRAQSSGNDDLWTHIREIQPTFISTLETGDASELAAYLCNLSRHDASHGTLQGYREYLKIKFNPKYRRFISLQIKDKLVALAEAVGAVASENPEQGEWGKLINLPVDELVQSIEAVIGIDISPPSIDGGLLKLHGSSACFHERDLNAVFTAWSLRNMIGDMVGSSICEIGAGTGRVAYWAWKFGVQSYAIVDLPHINVLQGFYLLKSLPDAPIRLYGEPEFSEVGGIEISPTYCIKDFSTHQFDLVLNQDSFPEIHQEIVRQYLGDIKKISRQYFLSINHESCPPGVGDFTHVNVQAIVEEVGGYHRLWRMPYWLRRGYNMELYEVNE